MNVKKTLLSATALLLCTIMLSSCAKQITINSPNDTYTVLSTELTDSFDGITATDGQSLLIIQLESAKNKIENAENDFFSYQKVNCQVTDGTYSSPCKSIAYAQDEEGKLIVVLIFDVPDSFAKSFSLIGDTIGVTQLTFKR